MLSLDALGLHLCASLALSGTLIVHYPVLNHGPVLINLSLKHNQVYSAKVDITDQCKG